MFGHNTSHGVARIIIYAYHVAYRPTISTSTQKREIRISFLCIELTTPIITSSGTNFPASIYSLANTPTVVCADTAARSISPVLKCMTPYLDWMISHCVPFPEAGAPAMMILGGDFLVDSDVAAAATVEDV